MCTNVEKFAISVWQFSPHCVVKLTTVYSTNYKTVWKSIVWELLPYIVHYHTHSKNMGKCGKNPQSVRRKPNYHTKCGKNCHKILSVHVFEVGDHCNLRTAWPISLKFFSLILYIIVLRMDKGFFLDDFLFIAENVSEILVE